MANVQAMLKSHPGSSTIDQSLLASAITALYDCAFTCTACADACLGESEVQSLAKCIRTDLDCADICRTTGAILSRQTETDVELLRAQLGACITACRVCAAECESHAGHHEHCRICGEQCRQCETACNQLLNVLNA